MPARKKKPTEHTATLTYEQHHKKNIIWIGESIGEGTWGDEPLSIILTPSGVAMTVGVIDDENRKEFFVPYENVASAVLTAAEND